jgi:hypothetical protein
MMLWETRSLCKYYHKGSRSEVRALDEVSLGIERGSLTVISGCWERSNVRRAAKCFSTVKISALVPAWSWRGCGGAWVSSSRTSP